MPITKTAFFSKKYRLLRMFLFAVAFIALRVFMTFSPGGLYLSVLNAAFEAGLVFLLVGMSLYIHNIGLFKTFRYWGYKFNARRQKNTDGTPIEPPMDLVAFTQFIMSQPKKPTAAYLLFGIGLVAISFIMVLL